MNLKCLDKFPWDFGLYGGIKKYQKDQIIDVPDIHGKLMVKHGFCKNHISNKSIQVEENKAIQSVDENKKAIKKLKLKLKKQGKI